MSVKTRVNIIIWMIYTKIVPDKNVFSWLIFYRYNGIYLHTAGCCHTKIKNKEAQSGVISWIQRRRKIRPIIGLPGGHAYLTSEHWLLSATVAYYCERNCIRLPLNALLATGSSQLDHFLRRRRGHILIGFHLRAFLFKPHSRFVSV